MEQKTVGAQTRRLRTCPSVLSFAAVGGRFEGEGPLREYFDELSEDHFFGEKTWEKGESIYQHIPPTKNRQEATHGRLSA